VPGCLGRYEIDWRAECQRTTISNHVGRHRPNGAPNDASANENTTVRPRHVHLNVGSRQQPRGALDQRPASRHVDDDEFTAGAQPDPR